MEIRTYIGRRLDHVNGILRRQIELDRYLKHKKNLSLTYDYYDAPKNLIDFISKRFFLYPFYAKCRNNKNQGLIHHITYQNIADIALFLEKEKTVVTVHDIFYFLERSKLKNPIFIQKYSLLGLKRARAVISISEFTKNQIIKHLNIPKEKICVIRNGMNQKMFFPIPEQEIKEIKTKFQCEFLLLHVGTEVFRKDLPTLFKALYLVKKAGLNVKLIRVGEPAHISLINSLGLGNHVIYISDISNERLRELYNAADLFVFPSLYEGWGAPGLEAAACGTPVACSDIPIFKEVYEDYPFYFPKQDHIKLAQLIIKLEKNREVLVEKKTQGIRLAKRHSWKKSSMKYLNLMKGM